MALVKDLARMNCSTTGTGSSLQLTTAVTGYKDFTAAGIQDGASYDCAIVDGNARATGTLTYINATKIATFTVLSSTNSDGNLALTGSAQVAIMANKNTFGMVHIESGTISTPVDYLDIDLPSGYAFFKLLLVAIELDSRDILAAAVSLDGGDTFKSDQIEGGTYTVHSLQAEAGDTVSNDAHADTLFYLGSSSQTDTEYRPGNYESAIDPGAPNRTFNVMTRAAYDKETSNVSILSSDVTGFFNPAATNPVTPARITTMRVVPYGNGDINPPTSGEQFISGSYFLYGVPTP